MDTLQQRILAGQRKINHLSEMVDKLPPGNKREELGSKVMRMLVQLDDLICGFIELNLGVCLYTQTQCRLPNKGTFHCASCPQYINSIYQS